jgi:hypothetical protein
MLWRPKAIWYVWIETYLGLRRAHLKAEELAKRDGIRTWVVPVPGKILHGYGHAFWIVTRTGKTGGPGTGWRRAPRRPLPWYRGWLSIPRPFPARRKEGA